MSEGVMEGRQASWEGTCNEWKWDSCQFASRQKIEPPFPTYRKIAGKLERYEGSVNEPGVYVIDQGEQQFMFTVCADGSGYLFVYWPNESERKLLLENNGGGLMGPRPMTRKRTGQASPAA
jgi:hypothetical protein